MSNNNHFTVTCITSFRYRIIHPRDPGYVMYSLDTEDAYNREGLKCFKLLRYTTNVLIITVYVQLKKKPPSKFSR